MDSIWQHRRSTHQDDDIRRWGYEPHDDVSSPSSFSPSGDGGIDMDWDDYPSGAIGGLFEEYCWCVDDVEGVMDSAEDSDPGSNVSSESAPSPSTESEDDDGYRYEYCEGIYFPDERSLL